MLANEGVGSNGATEFQQAIDEAKSVYNNTAVALKAEIDLMVRELAQAGVLYCAANPSGEVPIVKTYDFIPRGATGALGRLTVTGLKEMILNIRAFVGQLIRIRLCLMIMWPKGNSCLTIRGLFILWNRCNLLRYTMYALLR